MGFYKREKMIEVHLICLNVGGFNSTKMNATVSSLGSFCLSHYLSTLLKQWTANVVLLCHSGRMTKENKMLQLHMKTPTSSTSSSLACTCLSLSGNPETIGNANNGLIFMMKTTLLSPTTLIALHEKSLEWKVYLGSFQ
ncbi:uncharacterized protein LOC105783440 isoform X3 [Gossypium raimondii]|uniref:uncharacterized protein LOC105783440 isoform X3 n=1 Tax=Gossypium raimondii TaxID=29730 RepID=UPI00227C2C6A|nr:uncharacterized protein LOC105783440 isoform X3 [Gossypium raimondii]